MNCLLTPGEFKDTVLHKQNNIATNKYLLYLEYKYYKEMSGYDYLAYRVWLGFSCAYCVKMVEYAKLQCLYFAPDSF